MSNEKLDYEFLYKKLMTQEDKEKIDYEIKTRIDYEAKVKKDAADKNLAEWGCIAWILIIIFFLIWLFIIH